MTWTAAAYAVVIVASAAVAFALAVAAAAALDRPQGRHRLDGEKTARFFRSLATETPAPDPDRPVPYWPAYLPAPALRDAARAGQAPGAAVTGPPPAAAATLPRPGAAPPVAAYTSGPGQPPRQPWYTDHGPSQPGRLLAVGYGPFAGGPRAIIPDPRVSLRVTGAHAAITAGPPLVSRRYAAHEARRDAAVNTP